VIHDLQLTVTRFPSFIYQLINVTNEAEEGVGPSQNEDENNNNNEDNNL